MSNLLNVLRYIIKNATDEAMIEMATDLLNECKSYEKFSDEYNRIDDKFKAMDRESIARWICYYYYIESDDCDCSKCIYADRCTGGESK